MNLHSLLKTFTVSVDLDYGAAIVRYWDGDDGSITIAWDNGSEDEEHQFDQQHVIVVSAEGQFTAVNEFGESFLFTAYSPVNSRELYCKTWLDNES